MALQQLDAKAKNLGTFNVQIGCCGLLEYYGINNSSWTVSAFFKALAHRAKISSWRSIFGHAVLIDRERAYEQYLGQDAYTPKRRESRRLKDLKKFCDQTDFCALTIGKRARNPNSGNYLTAATFSITDHSKYIKFLTALHAASQKKDTIRPSRTRI